LRLQHYLDSLRVVTRRHQISVRHYAPSKPSHKHCFFLHGWASDSTALRGIRSHLQDSPAGDSWHFWNITYDTTWQPFPQSARQILKKLKTCGYDFEENIIIGYSMGGLVARQLVAEGFPCTHLVTLCTPHHGPVRWMPVPMRGPRSLAGWGSHTKALDRHPRDVLMRNRYHFFAMSYEDTFGPHDHDGMVSVWSALGKNLGEVATRHTMELKYAVPVSAIMPVDPHWRGMFPKYIDPALRHIDGLMRA
jgi:pimeloyl-ACP methyl ester carboxylesterase